MTRKREKQRQLLCGYEYVALRDLQPGDEVILVGKRDEYVVVTYKGRNHHAKKPDDAPVGSHAHVIAKGGSTATHWWLSRAVMWKVVPVLWANNTVKVETGADW